MHWPKKNIKVTKYLEKYLWYFKAKQTYQNFKRFLAIILKNP